MRLAPALPRRRQHALLLLLLLLLLVLLLLVVLVLLLVLLLLLLLLVLQVALLLLVLLVVVRLLLLQGGLELVVEAAGRLPLPLVQQLVQVRSAGVPGGGLHQRGRQAALSTGCISEGCETSGLAPCAQPCP